MTLMIMHIHQSRIISVCGGKERQRGEAEWEEEDGAEWEEEEVTEVERIKGNYCCSF